MGRRRRVVVYTEPETGCMGTGCGCLSWILIWIVVFFVLALVL